MWPLHVSVKENFLFLKSFDMTYIQVNVSIQSKIDAMIQFRKYLFKKTYLDEKIFVNDFNELKVGYLNINGLMDAGQSQ